VTSIARLYRDAQSSFVELFQSLDESDMAKPVPCTPLWSVRDVLSHVAGVTDDIANGRVEGAATEGWTAAQVERWRGADPQLLIEQWQSQIGGVAELLEKLNEGRPPFDCHSHEQDIRHAVDRVDDRPSEMLDWIRAGLGSRSVGRPVTISFLDGTTMELKGEGEPLELTGITQFEFVRSRLGRRSRDQVAGYQWSEPASDELFTNWFAFGPSEVPIVEAASRWG
jgi:hypothetical protein